MRGVKTVLLAGISSPNDLVVSLKKKRAPVFNSDRYVSVVHTVGRTGASKNKSLSGLKKPSKAWAGHTCGNPV